MKNNPAQTRQIAHRFPLMVYLAALAVAFTVSRPQPIYAHDDIMPPAVPSILEGTAGHKVFLEGHVIGTQNYICVRIDSGVLSWTFFGPQATLFDDHERQIITHFLSPNRNPNPEENGAFRPTWQHSRDTSTVWAMQVLDASSSDPAFVKPGAIPWLLLQVVGAQDGPTNGDKLSKTTFIQRLNTTGGVAPSDGCTESTDIGKRIFVPYDNTFAKMAMRQGG